MHFKKTSTTVTKVQKVSNKQKLGNWRIKPIGWKLIILYMSLIHILLHILNFYLIVTCQVGLCYCGATLPTVWTQSVARLASCKYVNMLNDSWNLEVGRRVNNFWQKTSARYGMLQRLGSGRIPWNDLNHFFWTFLPRTNPYNNL